MESKFLFLLISSLTLIQGKVVKYMFEIDYHSGAPDGVYTEHILAVNGKFPGPTIEVIQGDTVEVTVINKIQDKQNVTIHWHGIHQRDSIFYDGVSMVNQCPLAYGSYQVYRFDVPLAGTYWYHSHVESQYTEGLIGAFIVHPSNYHERYITDGEIIILLSDWYHHTAQENEAWYLSPASGGIAPYPDSSLINGLGRYPCDIAVLDNRNCSTSKQFRPVFTIAEYATYRVRVINAAGYSSFNFSIDGHVLETIEADGIEAAYPVFAHVASLSPGQRYSFIIRPTIEDYKENRFLIRAQVRKDFLRDGPNINQFPEALLPEATAVLQRSYMDLRYYPHLVLEGKEHFSYEEVIPPPLYPKIKGANETVVILDQMKLTPIDGGAPHYFNESHTIVTGGVIVDGVFRLAFNGIPFQLPAKIPYLFQALDPLTDGSLPVEANPIYIGGGTGYVIQLVINHPFGAHHPFHLHGHHFHVVRAGLEGEGNYDPNTDELNYYGVKRDVVLGSPQSHVVIRFFADNPGVWTFHCHIDWHNVAGMGFVFVENLPVLRGKYKVTDEEQRLCDLFR